MFLRTCNSMQGFHESYQSIKKWQNAHMSDHQMNADKLHLLHDYVIKNVFEITLKEMNRDFGPPPCEFSWFVMGSAGRCEQALISDQDHGLLYETDNVSAASYFLTFGKMLTTALDDIGYPLCEGNVMSSNPLWCQSEKDWDIQIKNWIHADTWESLRYLLIFFDARVVVGDEERVLSLKRTIFRIIGKQPSVLERLLENTKHRVKATGLFNQFLTITSGTHNGCIDLKNTALLPYVNAIRLLSMVERIESTSTLDRMEALCLLERYKKIMNTHHANFKKIIKYRLSRVDAKSYEDGRYINIKRLNKQEKVEMKQIFKDVEKIQNFIEIVVKGVIKNER